MIDGLILALVLGLVAERAWQYRAVPPVVTAADSQLAALHQMVSGMSQPTAEAIPQATEAPRPLTNTQSLLLMHDGKVEAEVSWHQPIIPAVYLHHEQAYRQFIQRADGVWEFIR